MTETYWNYRIWRIYLDDGAVYGLKETYYTDVDGKQLIQFWDAEPYWTEQEPSDFLVTIDRLEAEARAGKHPEWSVGYSLDDTLAALKNMRQAVSLPTLDEDRIMEEMSE